MDNNDIIARALEIGGYSEGLVPRYHSNEEIIMTAHFQDAYVFLLTMSKRLKAGDIEIVEKGDKIGRKDFYDELLATMKKNEI